MSPRLSFWLLVAGVVVYVLVPGHPHGLLHGVPLDWLGVATLGLLACLALAGESPTPQPPPPCAGEGRRGAVLLPLPRARGRGLGGRGLLLTIPILIVLKLVLWYVAPAYGLAATYYARARISGETERSTEYRATPFTRIEQEPGQPGFAIHFFNDVERFNYYEPPDPDRNSLPFAVRWEGCLHVPADGAYLLRIAARGTGILAIDGKPILTVGGRGSAASDELALSLTRGEYPIQLDFLRQTGDPPSMSFDHGGLVLTVSPESDGRLTADRYVGWLASGVDALVLLGILVVAGRVGLGALRRVRTARCDRCVILERPLLAVYLLAVVAYALVTTAGLAGRAVILEGGQDWLTYESYSRDILLNGPLMTLGEPLGKGKAFFFQPFYPYYLAGLHWLAGEGLWGPIALQIIGIGLAGVLVYFLARRLFGTAAAVASLALFTVLGLSQLDWIARKLLSENLYFILLPGAMLLVVRAIDRRRLADVVWAGLLLGVCAITRAPTLLFVPGAALIIGWGWRRAGDSWTRAGLAFVLLGVCTGSVAALVPIRNYVVSGRPALVATNGGATLLLAHQPTSQVRLGGVDRDPLYNALKLDRATREVVEFARQDPLGYLGTLVPLGLYSIGVSGAVEGNPPVAGDVLLVTVLYVVAVAMLPAARTLRALPLHLFVLIHLGIMMTFLPYVYGYRQVLPMQLLMLVFDGAVLAYVVGRLCHRRRARSETESQPLMEQRPA